MDTEIDGYEYWMDIDEYGDGWIRVLMDMNGCGWCIGHKCLTLIT